MASFTRRLAEAFLSIQCEGSTVGKPAFFIRFVGCNLRCSWCDSCIASRPHIWEKNSFPLDVATLNIPRECDRVILTGGEPTLQPLGEIITEIKSQYPHVHVIEVESNSTNRVSQELLEKVDIWNLSPKLHGTQEDSIPNDFPLRNLDWWVEQAHTAGWRDGLFKFVVSTPLQFEQVLGLKSQFHIPKSKIYIMRQGAQRERFIDNEFNFQVIDLCKRAGFNYSPRLHILIWNKATGV